MSSAQTPTKGSEAKRIKLPAHAIQQKIARKDPYASYRVKKQTVRSNTLSQPAKQAEGVSGSSNKRVHQQLADELGRTWWSALATKLLSVPRTAAKADFVALVCLRTVPSV